MMHICENHIVESNLKNQMRLQNIRGVCAFCGVDKVCLNTESPEVHNLLKAIVRYNYDEVDYNTHFGGDNFTGFLLADDFIFAKDIHAHDDAFGDLDGELWSMGFYVDDEINIFAGYGGDGIYNMPYMSIKNSHQPFLDSLSKNLSERNYHDFEDELRSIINSYDDNFAKVIEGGAVVYRARVGTAGYKVAVQEFSREGKKIFVPFKDKEIGAVPPLRATSGRVILPT